MVWRSIQRDATGQISGFTGGTGIASFQPYLQSIQDKKLLDPTGYQAYMSPYQQDVIDTTLAEFDKQAQIGKLGLGKSASEAGAFGGARHGIAQSEYQLGSDAEPGSDTSRVSCKEALVRHRHLVNNKVYRI